MGTTKTQKSEMDPIQEEFLTKTLLPFARKIAATPYETYEGERVAGFTPLQQRALYGYGQLQLPNELQEAGDVYREYAMKTPEERQAEIAAITDRYSQNVIDPTMELMRKERQEREVDLAQRRGKGFGNAAYEARAGAELGAYDVGMAKELGELRQKGLQYATTTVNQDAMRRMQAAGSLASTGMTGLQAQQGILGAQMGAGDAEQALNQRRLDVPYQDYLAAMQYPLTQFQVLQGGAAAFPAGIGTTTEKTGGLGPALQAAGSIGMMMAGMPPIGAMGGAGPLSFGSAFGGSMTGSAFGGSMTPFAYNPLLSASQNMYSLGKSI